MADVFLSQSQRQAADFLTRCVDDLVPLAALTGSAGCGKTVALNTVLARSEADGIRVVRVSNFVAGPLSLHRLLAASLGVADASELSAEALEPALRKALRQSGQAEPPVVAVDDAQSLLPEALRYLCLLASLRENNSPLFRILLVGRPGFAVRQSMPVQFMLEPMRPDDAREAVRRGLEAAGLRRHDDTVEEIVRLSQGNWRKLGLLLHEHVDGKRAAPAVTSAAPRLAAAAPARPQTSRRRAATGSRSMMPVVLAGLILAATAGATVAYQQGLFGDGAAGDGDASKMVSNPAPAPAPSAAPSVPAAAPAPATTSAPTPPLAPMPEPAPTAAPTSVASTPAPEPSKPPVAPAAPAPARPAADAVAAAKPAELPAPDAVPVTTPPVPPTATSPVDPGAPAIAASPPGAPAAVSAKSFRLYNISSCHHSVCPRWAVFDMERRTRFVAAFDPTRLHLDPDTVQRLREGVVDLTVRGTIVQGGPDGHVLDADQLESVEPHRPRIHQEAAAKQPPDDAAPLTQSPPPGFLSLPVDRAPLQLAPPPLPPPVPPPVPLQQ